MNAEVVNFAECPGTEVKDNDVSEDEAEPAGEGSSAP
jgi:hypothetical protein